MKVSLPWLKELVDYQLPTDDLANRLSLASIGIKQQTEDYLELDLTYNRGDLLSMRGVAYEVTALTETPLRFLALDPEDFIWVGKELPEVKVNIETDLVPFYCVAKIEGLEINKSSEALVKTLETSGVRSVNKVVDITNLKMLEYGQPMHAFDASKVKENIIVRLAKAGEKITTLDGKVRELKEFDLVIADQSDPIGIAGIMGGKDSEVGDIPTTIYLEAAIFDPVTIRKTSKRLGLYSEASKRFQHGLTKMRLLQAFDSAIRSYIDLGGKLTALSLVGDVDQEKRIINLSIDKLNTLLGENLDTETIKKCLEKLNFSVNVKEGYLEVTPPYFRLDIKIEEDVIEEVARIYGYEKIIGKELSGGLPEKLDESLPNLVYDTKKALADTGLTEVQTYSFFSTKVLQALGFNEENKKNAVRISNPISSETEYMRTFIWPNLIEVIEKKYETGLQRYCRFRDRKSIFSCRK